MAVSSDPTGKSMPTGGWQNGGWYSGYQYFNGSFAPSAGQIHPASNQQGAGTMVSPEVNRQTSVQAGLAPNANQDYVNKLNAQPVVNPSVQTNTGVPTAGATAGATTGATGAGVGYTAPEAINLQGIYDNAYKTAGISDIEKQLMDAQTALTNTETKINDNPFLSEASRVGRIAKTRETMNQQIKNLNDTLAIKKADVETKLNLATKQFDINSQVAKDALDRFNTLLGTGALDGASGEDIANITRATGLSSNAIYSAINAQKKKDIETQVITSTADDGTVTATVINSNTGEIIAKNDLGKISGTSSPSDKISGQDYKDMAVQASKAGKTYQDLIKFFNGKLDPKSIYEIYTAENYYGRPPDNVDPATGMYITS